MNWEKKMDNAQFVLLNFASERGQWYESIRQFGVVSDEVNCESTL